VRAVGLADRRHLQGTGFIRAMVARTKCRRGPLGGRSAASGRLLRPERSACPVMAPTPASGYGRGYQR
jgi:hypothetical protein